MSKKVGARSRRTVPMDEKERRRSILAYIAGIGKQEERNDNPMRLCEQAVLHEYSTHHAVVRAYAGTGKTFTEVVGVAYAYGSKALWRRLEESMGGKIVPSPEQQVVWDAMKGMGKMQRIAYCAFNKSIVTDFSLKWAQLVEWLKQEGIYLSFSTINSLGYKTCQQAFGRRTRQGVKYKTTDILADIIGRDIREVKRENPIMVNAVERLVALSKLNLLGWEKGDEFQASRITDDDIYNLCRHYDVDLEGNGTDVCRYVQEVMQKSYEMTWTLDFDDQNWMPVVRNLPCDQYDLLLVDEAQDLPRVRQEYALKCGRHILVVGDVHQAIYGFAGADVDSIPRMEQMLGVQAPLRLTQTRRCGKAIVEQARAIVPDFTAHESNCEGEVLTVPEGKYEEILVDGDGVLCRINAPLVSHALRRLKKKQKAIIVGRKFGEGLITFVKSFKVADVGDLVEALDTWYHTEVAKEQRMRNPSEDRLIALEDKKECVLAFSEGMLTTEDVVREIDKVFAGRVCPLCGQHYDEDYDRCFKDSCKRDQVIGNDGRMYPAGVLLVTPEGVQYSSVHRAKGREWDNVYILYPELIPHPMAKTAWAKGQEMNLKYVAITRAIRKLVYVPKGKVATLAR